MNMAPSSAYVVDDMMFLMSMGTLRTAPLFGGNLLFSDMKKWPLVRLLAFGLLRYEALLWIARTMLLVLYVIIVLGCDAA